MTTKKSDKIISLGKFEAKVVKSPIKGGVCPWSMVVKEKKTGVASSFYGKF